VSVAHVSNRRVLKKLQEGVKTMSERRLAERIHDWKMSHFQTFIAFEESFFQTLELLQ
jgi:transposase